jgi:plastocyanin
MKITSISMKMPSFSYRPLPAASKIVVGGLLSIALLWGVLSLLIGQMALFISAAVVLLLSGLVATGIRWTPVLVSLLGGFFLYVYLAKDSFTLYHLSHPKDTLSNPWISFVLFVFTLLLLWCAMMAVAAGMAALIQNYVRRERQTPRWLTAGLSGAVGLLLGAILIAALAPPGAAAATTDANGVATVHLGISNFSPTVVTVAKGGTLKLLDDGTFGHKLGSGTWVNGQPMPKKEAGAPFVTNLSVNGTGKSVEIGPFTTAGTYHIYCSIHSGMMLTITVQ